MPPAHEYEWGIFRTSTNVLEQGPITEIQAQEFLRSWIAMGGHPNAYYLKKRKAANWENL